ncbi:hypothetical protein TRV_07301, partial [Trichophyton verrucosum HKI 0517]
MEEKGGGRGWMSGGLFAAALQKNFSMFLMAETRRLFAVELPGRRRLACLPGFRSSNKKKKKKRRRRRKKRRATRMFEDEGRPLEEKKKRPAKAARESGLFGPVVLLVCSCRRFCDAESSGSFPPWLSHKPSVGSSRKDGEEKASIERLKKRTGKSQSIIIFYEEEKWIGGWVGRLVRRSGAGDQARDLTFPERRLRDDDAPEPGDRPRLQQAAIFLRAEQQAEMPASFRCNELTSYTNGKFCVASPDLRLIDAGSMQSGGRLARLRLPLCARVTSVHSPDTRRIMHWRLVDPINSVHSPLLVFLPRYGNLTSS